jgi:hypothetical protein
MRTVPQPCGWFSVGGLSSKRNSHPRIPPVGVPAPSLHGRNPLPRYYKPVRLPTRPPPGLCLPPGRWLNATSPGLPGSSTDLSSHAASHHPGRSHACSHPLLPRPYQASPRSGGLATLPCIAGPNRVRWRCGLRVRPGKASPEGSLPLALAGLLVARVIYKVNSFQFTRSARLVLALPRKAKDAYLGAVARAFRP